MKKISDVTKKVNSNLQNIFPDGELLNCQTCVKPSDVFILFVIQLFHFEISG